MYYLNFKIIQQKTNNKFKISPQINKLSNEPGIDIKIRNNLLSVY